MFLLTYSLIFRLRNDLYCVGWGVKLYSLTHWLIVNWPRWGDTSLERPGIDRARKTTTKTTSPTSWWALWPRRATRPSPKGPRRSPLRPRRHRRPHRSRYCRTQKKQKPSEKSSGELKTSQFTVRSTTFHSYLTTRKNNNTHLPTYYPTTVLYKFWFLSGRLAQLRQF